MVVTSGSIYPVLAKHTVQREFLLFISFIGLGKHSMVLEYLGGSLGDTRCVEALLGAIHFFQMITAIEKYAYVQLSHCFPVRYALLLPGPST